jgi:hypothetical protein
MTMTISGAIVVAFGNQATATDAWTHEEALYKAVQVLEEARAEARASFNDVNSTPPTVSDIYTTSTTVTDLSPCLKGATARVSWRREEVRDQSVELTTYLGDPAAAWARGGDCASSGPADEWKNPRVDHQDNLQPGGVQGTGIDVKTIDGTTYAFLTGAKSSASEDDLWAIDVSVSPPVSPPCLYPGDHCLDTGLGTGLGLNDVDVVRHAASGRYYAYVANLDTINQLQVIDVTDPANLELKASRSLVGVNPAGSYPQGREVFYYNDRVYVGTRETAGPEFHVFDVSDPLAPVELGQEELNHTVREIVVRDEMVGGVPKTLAYLATTGDSSEVIVLDVTDPSNITPLGAGFNAPGTHDGTSLYVLGERLYLGRERHATLPDFHILNISDPAAISELGQAGMNLGLNPGTEVSEVFVSGPLAFLATTDANDDFQVWNITDPNALVEHVSYDVLNSNDATGLDFVDDTVYMSFRQGKAFVKLVDDPP